MKKACMVVHSHYPIDPRVRREAEALLEDGWMVDVICLQRDAERLIESCGGAMVYRLPVRRHHGSGFAVYLLEYLTFFFLAALWLTWLHLRRRYDLVQVHTLPDFLVFTALVPQLLGARVVLDMHDLTPEMYLTKFGGSRDHPAIRLAQWVERRSAAFADHCIVPTESVRRRLIARGFPPNKLMVVMNSADPRLFRPLPAGERVAEHIRRFTLMYHGSIFERIGLDIAIRAVAQLRAAIPDIQFEIYGRGEAVDDLHRLIAELGLEEHVRIHAWVSLDEIPMLISMVDLGVVPWRQNPFSELAYPTKAFEYIAVGVPVIMARTPAVAELFGDVPDMFFEPESTDELAALILSLYQDQERSRQLLASARQAHTPYTWESQRRGYLLCMNRLTSPYSVAPDLEHS